MAVSVRDVAATAGVSVGTVSNVLNRPDKVAGDAVVTRLTIRVDSNALLPLQPQAIVHITADDVEVIQVVADAPDGEADR